MSIHVVAMEMAHEMNAGRMRRFHEAQLLMGIPELAMEMVPEIPRAERTRHCSLESPTMGVPAFGMVMVHGTKA
jgi:hypothetical protein